MWKSNLAEVQDSIGKLLIDKGYSINSSLDFGIEVQSA
jgi:hypothetical protein